MPFVRIDLFEGRTLEQKKALAKEVTEAVVRNTGAPQSAVHVIINDMPEGTYFPQEKCAPNKSSLSMNCLGFSISK